MNRPPLRVLVVDDSALYRKVVRAALEQLPNIEVIGHAQNGRLALDRIIADRPDVITLDMEMPELDGLGLLRELRERKIQLSAIMISTLTAAGAQATSQALQLGAQRPEHGLLGSRTRCAVQHGEHAQACGAGIAHMQSHALMQWRATLKHGQPLRCWRTKG